MKKIVPYQFIVLEGISGSGKTEIGTRLSEQIDAQYYTTPPALFREIRDRADRTLSLQSRFLFYLSSVVQASREIDGILERRSVVCDKYIWSTICYHVVYGLNVVVPPRFTYRQPDYAFLLICEDGTRLRRIRNRGDVEDAEDNLRQEMERKCLVEFRKHLKWEVDNTAEGPQRTVEEILTVIQKR